jgi:predicted ATPase
VLGSEFSYELLHAVHAIAEADLQQALSNPADAELVYVRGIAPEATYQFKHALIRDAAYEALLKSRRKELHRQVAVTIEEKFRAVKEAHPEVLARHWTEAGEIERAIAEWERADKTAERRNAFHEAQESFQQALELLNQLPESLERDGREVELRQSLVSMLGITRWYTARETIESAEQVAALGKKSSNLGQLFESTLMRSVQAGLRVITPPPRRWPTRHLSLRYGQATRHQWPMYTSCTCLCTTYAATSPPPRTISPPG